MTKSAKNILILAVILGIAGLSTLISRQREVVGVDQVGVVVSPGGKIAVYRPGDRPLVLPLIQHYVRLTAKPIRYDLTEAKAITVTGSNQQTATIGCQVRYQVEDAAKLVATQGIEAPQNAIELLIHQRLTDEFTTTLQKENATLDDVQTRVVLVGSIHHSLKEALSPLGITILSFDLISW